MPLPTAQLEYDDEEDLFGSDAEPSEINSAPPLATTDSDAGPSRSRPLAARLMSSPSKGKMLVMDAQQRLEEFREKKRHVGQMLQNVGKGTTSLKAACMMVIRANSTRIWDVGDMEYSLIRPFIDELPQDQLVDIETASPHIKKDTDWLWEIFLLQEHPLFHERCRERKGEARTSGWRRMYRKAKEDAEERQSQAASRVAERYRQLEAEKAAKRIVFVDKVVPSVKKRVRGGATSRSGWGARNGGGGGNNSSNSAASALAKARADVQRARVALTHASGKYIPPLSRPQPKSQSKLYDNPVFAPLNPLPHGARLPPPRPQPKSQSRFFDNPDLKPHGPRLTPPRIFARPTDTASSLSSPIPGAYLTHQHNEIRKALPDHLKSIPKAPSTAERFRLPDNHVRPKQSIRKPEVKNFQPPSGIKDKPRQPPMDIFDALKVTSAAPKGFLESLGRARDDKRMKDGQQGQKRAREPELGESNVISQHKRKSNVGSSVVQ